jgi:hypothetical protein
LADVAGSIEGVTVLVKLAAAPVAMGAAAGVVVPVRLAGPSAVVALGPVLLMVTPAGVAVPARLAGPALVVALVPVVLVVTPAGVAVPLRLAVPPICDGGEEPSAPEGLTGVLPFKGAEVTGGSVAACVLEFGVCVPAREFDGRGGVRELPGSVFSSCLVTSCSSEV